MEEAQQDANAKKQEDERKDKGEETNVEKAALEQGDSEKGSSSGNSGNEDAITAAEPRRE